MNAQDIHPGITGRGGQPVIHKSSGKVGMTTGERAKNTPTIGVIWQGQPYDTREQLTSLTPAVLEAFPLNF